jgi:nucleoside 2-deoxyribosyltransferase
MKSIFFDCGEKTCYRFIGVFCTDTKELEDGDTFLMNLNPQDADSGVNVSLGTWKDIEKEFITISGKEVSFEDLPTNVQEAFLVRMENYRS